MDPGRRRRITCLVLGLLAPVAVGAFFWVRYSPPQDRVHVRLVGLPESVPFYCIAAFTDGPPQAFDWYINTPHGRQSRHPKNQLALKTLEAQQNPVRWRPADQYGLVTYSPENGWRIYRFRADEIPLEGGGLVSSRWATFDLTGRPAELLGPATVDQLGLSAVPQELADNRPPPPKNP